MRCPERCQRAHPETSCYVCSGCGVEKGPNDFYRYRSGPRTGRRFGNRCKACQSARQQTSATTRIWRQRQGREADLRRHSTDGDSYDAMLAAQGGGCAICGTSSTGSRSRFAIDHDHACCDGPRSCGGCIRGLLCLRCNAGLGMFVDDPALLLKAVTYLERT